MATRAPNGSFIFAMSHRLFANRLLMPASLRARARMCLFTLVRGNVGKKAGESETGILTCRSHIIIITDGTCGPSTIDSTAVLCTRDEKRRRRETNLDSTWARGTIASEHHPCALEPCTQQRSMFALTLTRRSLWSRVRLPELCEI